MRWRRAAMRAPFLVVHAVLLTFLAMQSSLVALLPPEITPFPLALYALIAFLLALAPTLLASGSPLPTMLLALVPAAVLGGYEASHLDWLRVLKDFGVASPGAPSPARLALAVAAFATAWGAHAVDFSSRLRERLAQRGVPANEARAASHAALRRAGATGGAALAGFLGLALVGALSFQLAAPLGRATFLMPVLAAALVAAAAVALAVRARGEPESGEEA